MKPIVKWADVEAAVYDYVSAHRANLSLADFRMPLGGNSGRRYIGLTPSKLWKLDPPWVRLSETPCDYDDSLWRGVRAYESFCIMLRARKVDGKSCAEYCDAWLAS